LQSCAAELLVPEAELEEMEVCNRLNEPFCSLASQTGRSPVDTSLKYIFYSQDGEIFTKLRTLGNVGRRGLSKVQS